MAYKTLEEQLQEVQTQIEKAQRSQNIGIAGRSIQRANLDSLYRREKELKLAIFRKNQKTSYNYFVHE